MRLGFPEDWSRELGTSESLTSRTAGVSVLSLVLCGLHLCFSACPLYVFPLLLPFRAPGSGWLPHSGPSQPQFEFNRDLINVLESLFSFPGGKYDGLSMAQGTYKPWVGVTTQGGGIYHKYDCQGPWEV